jgi:hypothetical protein
MRRFEGSRQGVAWKEFEPPRRKEIPDRVEEAFMEPVLQTKEEDLEHSIRMLTSWRAAERAAAERMLLERGAQSAGVLLSAIKRERRRYTWIAGLAFGLSVLIILLGVWYISRFPTNDPLFVSLMLLYILPGIPMQLSLRRIRLWTNALFQLEDKHAIGPLSEVLALPRNVGFPAREQSMARAMLVRLLPSLTPDDAAMLTDYQRACLRRTLAMHHADLELALVLAILKALAVIGDARALPHVVELAWGRVATANQRRAQEEAQACLPILKARIAKAQDERTLLRPAETPAGTLLRPAPGVPQGDPQTLLRPTEAEPDRNDVPRSVGLLIEQLDAVDNHARVVAHEALADLLPRLRAEDAPLLTREHRARLYRALRFSSRFQWPIHKDVPLVVAILKALEQVGDARALPEVERLAVRSREPRIRTAAQSCLPALRERIAQEREQARLLRPADSPSLLRPARAPVENLVRPAQGPGNVEPEKLLRPGGKPTEES